MADGSRLRGRYSDELIKALWSDADEAAVRSWEQQKRAAFDAGGELKATHGTRAALEEWMAEKVYGLGGTMDRNSGCAPTRGSFSTSRPMARRSAAW